MNTLKTAPAFRKLHNVSATANMLALHEKVQHKHVASISELACEARNPLTSINLSIDMLQSGIKDNYRKEFLDIIRRNSIRINDTIDSILMLLQTDNIQSEKNSIYQAIDEIIEMARDPLIPKNIRIRKDNDAQGCTIEIIMDKTLH
jgi:signal transduction histidine kinase